MAFEFAEEVNVALAPFTTLRVGGPARRFVEVTSEQSLIDVIAFADATDGRVLLVAGGSNLVVADEGFDGLAVRIQTRGVEVEQLDESKMRVTAAAGERWDRLVAQLTSDGISGLETLSGIPGSVGATPIQNVGAYGAEVSQFIEWVDVYDRHTGDRVRLAGSDCGFAYRSSLFKLELDRWLVRSVAFRLTKSSESVPIRYAELADALGVAAGETAPLEDVRRTVLSIRRGKGMVLDIDDHDTWSAGSFFTNPIIDSTAADRLPEEAPTWTQPDGRVKVSAAWLISQAGFERGWSLPDSPEASLSHKHALAITNRGGASSAQILDIATAVARGVELKFGIDLAVEPRVVSSAPPPPSAPWR